MAVATATALVAKTRHYLFLKDMKKHSSAPAKQHVQPSFVFSPRSYVTSDPELQISSPSVILEYLPAILIHIGKKPTVADSFKLPVFKGDIEYAARLRGRSIRRKMSGSSAYGTCRIDAQAKIPS